MDIYNIKWSILLAIAILVYSFKLCKKYHWSAGALFGYVGLNALYTFSYPTNLYNQFPKAVFNTLTGYTAKSFVALLLVIILVDLVKKDLIPKLFVALMTINSIYTIYQFFTVDSYINVTGFFDNISLNGGLMALSIPIVLKKYNKIFLIPLITAILCCKASVASGVMALALSSFYFAKHKKVLIPIILFCGALGIASLVDDGTFKHSGRAMLYKIQTKAFFDDSICYQDKSKEVCLDNGNKAFGRSPGTFHFWAFITQLKYYLSEGRGKRGELIRFLHSDWLQIMIDLGYVGLGLSLILAFYLMFMSWGSPMMFSMLISYMGFMVFHYPIHYPAQAFVGIWIIMYIILNYKKELGIIIREV